MGMARYKNIYFGKDSVFKKVKDTGKPGVDSRSEFKKLVFALLEDLADKKTKNHEGKTIRFTKKVFLGRMLILSRINSRKHFGYKELIKEARKIGLAYLGGRISRAEYTRLVKRLKSKY